ncbi:hypothetical protein PT974_02183 [Cladobotryum mycophilum]|uniref:Uncharacterized protein n=1 Tax=Cladobotryum mycophilum TaxID=491253 RepID=A0ABR0SXE5_9HYPO
MLKACVLWTSNGTTSNTLSISEDISHMPAVNALLAAKLAHLHIRTI